MRVGECPRRSGGLGPDQGGEPGLLGRQRDGGRGESGGGGGSEHQPAAEEHYGWESQREGFNVNLGAEEKGC